MIGGRRREDDALYFYRRAAQERGAADAAAGQAAELPHRFLAEQYGLIAASIEEVHDKLGLG
jgi:hypothetical protein